MSDARPVVGRDAELAFLERALRSSRRTVVIGGPAGVGKSRLAGEFAAAQAESGYRVATVRATRCTATIPFGAFARYVGDGDAQGEAPLGRLGALRRAADELLGSSVEPLIVVVDDAHLLDEGSAALLLHLAEADAAVLVVTVRSDEPAPDAVVALWKEGLAERIELLPLSQPESAELLSQLLDGRVAAATVDRIWGWVRGNPLFLAEVVRAGQQAGVLTIADGSWRWDGPMPNDSRLTELITDRLVALEATERLVVDLLAFGEPLSLEVLADIANRAAVEAAEDHGLVVIRREGPERIARLGHPLYGELLVRSTSAVRAEDIYARLAAAVEAHDGTGRELLRIARWRLDAGGMPNDPDLFLAAAHRAMAVSDFPLAERLAAASEAAGGGDDAIVARAEAVYWLDRYEETDAILRGVHAEGPTMVRAAIIRSSALFWGLGRWTEANAVLEDALGGWAGELPEHGRDPLPERQPPDLGLEIRAHRASLLFFAGRAGESASEASAVLAAAPAGSIAHLRALAAAVPAWAAQGDVEAAAAGAERGIVEAIELVDTYPSAIGDLTLGLCLAHCLTGDLATAQSVADGVREVVLRDRAVEWEGAAVTLLGRVMLAQGRVGTAGGLLTEAVGLLRRHDPGALLPWCLGLLAEAEALAGRPEKSAPLLEEAQHVVNPAVRVYECEMILAGALALAARGERSAARNEVSRAAAQAANGGVWAVEARAWHELARLGEPAIGATGLDALADRVRGPMMAAWRDHAHALVAGDGTGLDRVAAVFAGLGAVLLAAEASAEAAEVHRAAGLVSRALEASARAVELHGRCEGARTAALDQMGEAPGLSTLTAREREIVELAGRGLSNREIAERLVVSMRTVNNHLNHAYAKLGTSDRDGLRAVLALSGPRPAG